MKCPWCGKEMTDGFINSARQVLFSENPNSPLIFTKAGGDINLTQHNWTRPSSKAYHCKSCKKVIVDYGFEIE